MRIRVSRAAIVTLATLIAADAVHAGPVLHDQTNISLPGAFSITSAAVANDFELADPTRMSSAVVWLADSVVNDNGVLDSFSGTLSWAFYGDSGGHPDPTNVLGGGGAMGGFVQIDTGLQNYNGQDIVAVRIPLFDTLPAGRAWFAIHEGVSDSTNDGTSVGWEISNSVRGSKAHSKGASGLWVEDIVFDATFMLFGDFNWDQLGYADGADWEQITDQVVANDFTLAAPGNISAGEAYLSDGDITHDNALDSFSGKLSWAVYANAVGGKPGAELAHGNATNVQTFAVSDNAHFGFDINRVSFALGQQVSLPAGTYWFALKEGDWGVLADDSWVGWLDSTQLIGGGRWLDDVEAAPGAWPIQFHQTTNSAFRLFDGNTVVFASGFESGKSCAWPGGSGAPCP